LQKVTFDVVRIRYPTSRDSRISTTVDESSLDQTLVWMNGVRTNAYFDKRPDVTAGLVALGIRKERAARSVMDKPGDSKVRRRTNPT